MTTVQKVTFSAGDVTLTGNLFLPAGAGPAPGIVVAGTWTSVKELMADRYAERLADRGFAALSFDFTGYGESEGEPRDYEVPERKVRDINHAVTFLAGHPAVDATRLGALGVCAAAMYMSGNAVDDPRIRSLALVAPWLHDPEICREVYGGEEGVADKLADAARARATYEATGEVEYVPVVSGSDPRAAMPFDIDFYLNPDRGGLPQWPNRFAVMAWPGWLGYDSISLAPRLSRPVLLVHSEDAAIPHGARRFHAGLAGPKEFVWTEGDQFAFYDQEPQVTTAVDAAAAHFRRTLSHA
ncbi:alpha/beta fold hydrolase [Nonomuraea sp. SMC257]|uniref:Alpha/beta fold hydrolase n=1 Tax=Nonomuraea montanisoli TaxID=2741721 RepID=A0A7Y6IHC0_9ACTN|nr:alpha/beta fold hydrolase [Nonomuraea montanisoli]NUW38235.1 alpha/beta fold hydrolase [Nonomuraea montanisoli]